METTRYPRLRHFTMLSNNESESLHIVVGTEHFEMNELLGSRDEFLNVKRYFDGRHSIEEISTITNVSIDDIKNIVNCFDELGILRKEGNDKEIRIDKNELISKVNQTCLMWQRQIGYHKLFNLLKNKLVRKEVLIGLLIETYHYVKSAPEHTGTALVHCKNDKWKNILLNYLVDEFDHSKYYLDALIKLGIPEERIHSAHPLIGTSSLINMLNEIGRKSTLGYLACTNLFEANKFDYQNSKEVIQNIFSLYDFPVEAINGPITHMEADLAMNHNSLFSDALNGSNDLDIDEINYAINCVHDLKHSFDQYHDQILQYYSDISNYIPRLKVDYNSL